MRANTYTSLVLALLIVACWARIDEVTLNSFDGSLVFVQVYEDGCPNCAAEQRELDDASKLFSGLVKFGKINLKNIPAMKGQKLPRNPSYFLVRESIQDFSEYKEKISRVPISKFILSEIEKVVKSRDSKLFGGKGSSDQKSAGSGQKSAKSQSAQKDASGVTVLTDNNFEQTVLKSNEAWFVQFYSPSCGHCHALQPEWNKLPAKIGKRVRIAKIDATVNRQMSQKFQIKGFPTLLFFGTDDKSSPVPYNSERTAQAMVAWLQGQKIGQQKLQFLKLSKQLYDRECNRNIVCLIFILQKKSELKDINFIEDLMQQNKAKPLRFFYSGRLTNFETALMIEDRKTPKLVSIWDSINSYKVFNGATNQQEIQQYINKIMQRRTWIKLADKVNSVVFPTEAGSTQL